MVGLHAAALARIGEADAELAVLAGEAIGARKDAEVLVEGAVLLHDHDDVLDLLDRSSR